MITSPRTLRAWFGAALLLASLAAHPAETLDDFDGKSRELGEFVGHGKWVVMMLWASDCHVCNEEAPALNAFHERHKDRDAIMLGVSLDGADGKAAAESFLERHAVSFDSLLVDLDQGASMYTRLTGRRWIGTPTFLVFAPDGKLAAQQVGAVEVEILEDFIASRAASATN